MINDSDFITLPDVPGPTKEEIRCLVMCKSKVQKNDIVVDIGCGTGGLTLEFAKRVQKVYSIDKNSNSIKLTHQNLIKHNLQDNVELMESDALEALEKIENFDVVMVGGSSGDLSPILENAALKLKSNGRIVVSAILLETKVESIKKLKELGFNVEIIEVNVSKGRILDRGTMMLAQNPIALIYTV
jgi:cobalt-precorrin-6B (C15)-methyltransferase